MRAKDARAVGRHLAGDYVSTARDGTRTTRAEVKRAMPAIFRSLTAVDHRSRVLKLTMTTPAVAWARVRADSTLRVEQPGQDLLVISQTVFEDQWVRTTAGWRLRRSRAVSVTEAATLNGRPFVLTGPVARG